MRNRENSRVGDGMSRVGNRAVLGIAVSACIVMPVTRRAWATSATAKVVFASYSDSDNGSNLLDSALFSDGRFVYDADLGKHSYLQVRYPPKAVAELVRQVVAAGSTPPPRDLEPCPTDIGDEFLTVGGQVRGYLTTCGPAPAPAISGSAFAKLRAGLIMGTATAGRSKPEKVVFAKYALRTEPEYRNLDFVYPKWPGDSVTIPSHFTCTVGPRGPKNRKLQYMRGEFLINSTVVFVELSPVVEDKINGQSICDYGS